MSSCFKHISYSICEDFVFLQNIKLLLVDMIINRYWYDSAICPDICLIVQGIISCIDLLILINYKINYQLIITSLIYSCIIILVFYVFYYKQSSSGNNLLFTTSRNRMSCFAFEPLNQCFFTFSVPEKTYTNTFHRKNSIELFILNPIFLMSLDSTGTRVSTLLH